MPICRLEPRRSRRPLDVSRQSVNAIETGRYDPSLPLAFKIEATGTGWPIILIPGASSPRAVWAGVVPDLATRHTVHLVQVNGFGGDAPGANLKPGLLDGVVADLATYIAAHRIEQAAIVGHSMGGLIGLMVARAHPDRLSRLMIGSRFILRPGTRF